MILTRKERKRKPAPSTLIAYDLETTRIGCGTPRPLYLTAFSKDTSVNLRATVRSIEHLRALLITNFLTDSNNGARFVAWNANHFDAYFVAAALILERGYVIKPFLTRSKNLRGMLVLREEEQSLPSKSRHEWYFLDGMAMTGLQGMSLEKFLDTFAPSYRKLTGAVDFSTEEFDPANPLHVDYAVRDSEGLYHGIRRAEDILLEHFGEPLGVTIGRSCIKIFTSHIPANVTVIQPEEKILDVLRTYVMRGGFCHCARRYEGPIWKYDINQAYAAAMRDVSLPAGKSFVVKGRSRFGKIYVARVRATNSKNRIPFYYKTADALGRVRARFDCESISDTWLTSIEIEQLQAEGWRIDWLETIVFDSSFTMIDYVNKLEHLRMTCEGGPNGAVGTMIKAVGNHSYGKTVEQLDSLDFLIAKECPDGFAEYFAEETEPSEFYFPHIWYRRLDAENDRPYHQPQIGSFITAHVRMVIRRAALANPDAWIYADTDCVVFSENMHDALDIHPRRYGAFKVEAEGEHYRFLGKKIYASVATKIDEKTKRVVPTHARAKGLNLSQLSADDFERWYAGSVPEQEQLQRQNFLKTMRGSDMFIARKRKGTML